MNKSQEVIYNSCNGNIIDIQLVPFYEKQEEIKWTFELGKLYLVAVHNK